MKYPKTGAVLALTAISWAHLVAQAPPNRSARSLPEGAGREVTQRVCGATCHGPDTIMGKGRSREQWTAVVNAMVARGAKATDAELVQIAEYLTARLGPNSTPESASARGSRSGAVAPVAGRGPGPLGAGAANSHVVDDAGAERGKTVYTAECITCHGLNGRGGNDTLPAEQRGPDLVRSVLVLHDRYGNEIGPFLAKNHPLRSGRKGSSLTTEQVGDLAHFLHQTVYYTLRSGPMLKVQNILTGDAKAGAAYFNGEGKCSGCHSPTGDLAGVGRKYDPPTLQTKFLFPRSVGFGRAGARTAPVKPVTVAVTLADGTFSEGELVRLDDFNVSLRDAQGQYKSFKITPQVKVVKNDPYAMHVTMLDQYTDKNIHDIVAYLESLK
ncbi:c-type cytochrome [Paludibaculum fermentans]|uniref:c-type cytochrome n=1 Tax=Paludibaculum fermentans TaxID=1473598 RepID=UPI003EBB52A0